VPRPALLLVSAVFAAGFAPAPFAKPDPGKADLAKMQGEWAASAYHSVAKNSLKWTAALDHEAAVVGKANLMTFYRRGKPTSEWLVRRNGRREPREINLEAVSGGWRCRGIYRWDGPRHADGWSWGRNGWGRPEERPPVSLVKNHAFSGIASSRPVSEGDG
jgi:hypothetical protein